jgi:hypothetical protein
VRWALEKKTSKYTARSLYRMITFGGVKDQQIMDVQDSTRSLEDPNQYLEGFP